MRRITLLFSVIALTAAAGSIRAFQTDVPMVIPANEAAGFAWPYVLHLPGDVDAAEGAVLIVETNNTGARDDFAETLDKSVEQAAGRGIGPMLARHLKQPFLMPVFPRTKREWQVYTHALDRDTMLVESGELERIDLQLLAMVEDAKGRIERQGVQLSERFVLCGFSASGTFANRFAFLHPGRVAAVVAGGLNAFPMLPVDGIDGDALQFPLGTADLETIAGAPFDRERWVQVPQMLFMGALDDNDAVAFDDAYSEGERQLIFRHLGQDMHRRWLQSQWYYLDAGASAKLVTYGHAGHWTDRQIGMDIVHFIQEALGGP